MKHTYVTPPTDHGEPMLLVLGAASTKEAKTEAAMNGALPDTIQQYSNGSQTGFCFRLNMYKGGYFKHERGIGWLGIAYQLNDVSKTVFIQRDTDHGVIACREIMERIGRMSDEEKFALVTR